MTKFEDMELKTAARRRQLHNLLKLGVALKGTNILSKLVELCEGENFRVVSGTDDDQAEKL